MKNPEAGEGFGIYFSDESLSDNAEKDHWRNAR